MAMRTARRETGVEVGPRGRHVAQPGYASSPVPPRAARSAPADGAPGRTVPAVRGRRAVRDPDDVPFLPAPAPGPDFDPLTDPLPEALLEPLRDGLPEVPAAAAVPAPPVTPGGRSVDVRDLRDAPGAPRRDAPSGRRPAPGVVASLLRSAVALQAEDLLRSIGALAVAAQRSEDTAAHVDWIGWVERDVRDLGHLARAALEVGATLPAGLDVGGGDPARPETVIEGLLAGHEAVLAVLRHLDAVGGAEPWNGVVGRITARREAEAAALRVTVGDGTPREPDRLHTGRAPDAMFSVDLLH